MRRKGRKGSSKASAISDRSGFKFPMSEMVIEPGTGWLVHRSESDGQWSLSEHPQNNLNKYLRNKHGDPFPVENARPRPSTETVSAITTYQTSVRMGGVGYLTALPAENGSVNITGSGKLYGFPNIIYSGSATISGSGSLEGSGDIVLQASSTISGSGSLEAEGFSTYIGSASITGSGTLYGSIGVEYLVSESGDDGYQGVGSASGTDWDSVETQTSALLFQTASGGHRPGIRFQNIAVDQGATITQATLVLNQGDTTETTGIAAGSYWYAWDTDNAGQFSTAGTQPNDVIVGGDLTTATGDILGTTSLGPVEIEHDVTDIVQEIVNRVGWSSGNAINFIGVSATGSNNYFITYDAGSLYPKLVISS